MPLEQQTSVPTDWIELDVGGLTSIEKMWERVDDGLTVGIVEDYDDAPNDYAGVVLAGSHIKSYGDDGLLWSFDRMEFVEEGVRQWMQEHTTGQGFSFEWTEWEKEPEPKVDISNVFTA